MLYTERDVFIRELISNAADALEKLGRSEPEALVGELELFLRRAETDPIPMVRWHLAMLLGHLSSYPEHRKAITGTLLRLLDDQSVFTQSYFHSEISQKLSAQDCPPGTIPQRRYSYES